MLATLLIMLCLDLCGLSLNKQSLIEVTLHEQGRIICLHVVNDLLFSGGEDKQIKAWKYNPATESFDPVVRISISKSLEILCSVCQVLFVNLSVQWSHCTGCTWSRTRRPPVKCSMPGFTVKSPFLC